MPLSLSGSNIAGTDDIFLEYVDYSPAESKYVGQTSKVIFVTLSNSGDFNTLGQSELSQTEDDEKLSSKESGGGCLIATATYGTELAPQVQQLRELRDNSLLKTETGSTFMAGFNDFYYSFSPTIADMERQNPVFREAVKIAITPMVSTLSILNHFELDSEVSVLGYGLAIITLNVGMYFVAPTIIILKIRKIF